MLAHPNPIHCGTASIFVLQCPSTKKHGGHVSNTSSINWGASYSRVCEKQNLSQPAVPLHSLNPIQISVWLAELFWIYTDVSEEQTLSQHLLRYQDL